MTASITNNPVIGYLGNQLFAACQARVTSSYDPPSLEYPLELQLHQNRVARTERRFIVCCRAAVSVSLTLGENVGKMASLFLSIRGKFLLREDFGFAHMRCLKKLDAVFAVKYLDLFLQTVDFESVTEGEFTKVTSRVYDLSPRKNILENRIKQYIVSNLSPNQRKQIEARILTLSRINESIGNRQKQLEGGRGAAIRKEIEFLESLLPVKNAEKKDSS